MSKIIWWLTLYSIILLLLGAVGSHANARQASAKPASVSANPSISNKQGIKMIKVLPGSFQMGAIEEKFDLGKKTDFSRNEAYYDESPVHQVAISYPFYISETEITIEQFRKFRKSYKDKGTFKPYVTGVSWNEATAFCEWLSKKEGKEYRLPTEAEWEYACRAGSNSLFWSGEKLPAQDVNPWGIRNMHSSVAEWCYDWYGEYPAAAQADPVGYEQGWARVVRGGPINTTELHGESTDFKPITDAAFFRSSNRASMVPDCPAKASERPSPHFIGFRVVQAPLPATKPWVMEAGFPLQGVRQDTSFASVGPAADIPYFKARQVMASPPDLTAPFETALVGLDRANQGKVHSSGFVNCPNGDLMLVGFSSSRTKSEAAPNTTMVVTRLRKGAEEWEMPTVFYNRSGVNDQSALLWNDNGTLWFFGGGRSFGDVPFVFTTSTDNGATWSELKTPVVKGKVGPITPQPINSAFRGPDNTIYFGGDGNGSQSFLWASKDNGNTWFDTGGRTQGRHTTFVLLKDKRILGMGGKNSDIDGYMPKFYSSDNGKTWTEMVKTPFAAMGSNQRPAIIRLQSGRLFMAGDYQDIRMLDNPPPTEITDRGSYVALSEDEGETWKIKRLALAPEHNDWHGVVQKGKKPQHGFGTVGYCAAVQSQDGLIHLMTSKGKPSMHFALNEAWIHSNITGEVNQLPGDAATAKLNLKEEKHPNGQVKVASSGWVGKNGYVLHGRQTWFYPTGTKQYEATFHNGEIKGQESYWSREGQLLWTRDHTPFGTTIWTNFWPNGKKKTESTWWGLSANGPTTNWNQEGNIISSVLFEKGRLVPQEKKPTLEDIQ